MKATIILLSLCAISLISCVNGASSFTGKWQPLTYSVFPKRAVLTIEKQGSKYMVTNSITPDEPLILTYIDSENKLMGNVHGIAVELTIDKASKHLWFSSPMASPTEFQKIP